MPIAIGGESVPLINKWYDLGTGSIYPHEIGTQDSRTNHQNLTNRGISSSA